MASPSTPVGGRPNPAPAFIASGRGGSKAQIIVTIVRTRTPQPTGRRDQHKTIVHLHAGPNGNVLNDNIGRALRLIPSRQLLNRSFGDGPRGRGLNATSEDNQETANHRARNPPQHARPSHDEMNRSGVTIHAVQIPTQGRARKNPDGGTFRRPSCGIPRRSVGTPRRSAGSGRLDACRTPRRIVRRPRRRPGTPPRPSTTLGSCTPRTSSTTPRSRDTFGRSPPYRRGQCRRIRRRGRTPNRRRRRFGIFRESLQFLLLITMHQHNAPVGPRGGGASLFRIFSQHLTRRACGGGE